MLHDRLGLFVQNVINTFEKVAESPQVRFIGNVEVGTDISMAELQERYSGIVLAYGADQDKTFGLPGTSMALVAEGGCVMTRALEYMHVAWKPFFASQYGSAQEPVGHDMFVLWTPSFQVKSVAEYYRRETLLDGTTGYRTAGISSLTCLGIPPSCSAR